LAAQPRLDVFARHLIQLPAVTKRIVVADDASFDMTETGG
jgi:hypothetical protein